MIKDSVCLETLIPKCLMPGMVAPAYKSTTPETEAGGPLQGQYSEFKADLNYTARLQFKK